jgi:hypothetical protein
MSLEHAPSRPRRVVRVSRLKDFFGLSHSQLYVVIDELVKAGLLTKPFNAAGGTGSAKSVFEDEIVHIQEIGVAKALAEAKDAT